MFSVSVCDARPAASRVTVAMVSSRITLLSSDRLMFAARAAFVHNQNHVFPRIARSETRFLLQESQ
jgi:hypothetical protein